MDDCYVGNGLQMESMVLERCLKNVEDPYNFITKTAHSWNCSDNNSKVL